MATARLVGDLITLDVAHRENDLAKMTPGMRYHPRGDEHSPRPHFVFPLAWASCVALRGVFKENLTVDPELSAWARNELETRIQPALALRDVLELPTDHPLTERFAAWDSPTSVSSPGSAASTSPSKPMDSPASDRSRTNPTASRSSSDTGPTSRGGETSTSSPLLPTPTQSQPGGTAEQHLARKARMPDGAKRTSVTDLRMKIETLLPTPNASQRNYDEDPATWRARQAKIYAEKGIGNGPNNVGPLGIAVKEQAARGPQEPLLPTPTVGDSSASGHRQAEQSPRSHAGTTLSDWATSPWASTSSSGDTPASPSAPPASEEEPTIPDIYGRSSPVLLASFDHDSSSWRTSEDISASVRKRLSKSLPPSGMTRRGSLYELPMSKRPTAAKDGSASLRTPHGMPDPNNPRHPGPSGNELGRQINEQSRLLPTASSRDHKGPRGENATPGDQLPDAIDKMLPTPNPRDHHAQGATHNPKAHSTALSTEIQKNLLPEQPDKMLPTPKTPTGGSEGRRSRGTRGSGGADLEGAIREELLPTPDAWLGRREANATADPVREKTRRHEGVRGKRSKTLPEALASPGGSMSPPSEDGSE